MLDILQEFLTWLVGVIIYVLQVGALFILGFAAGCVCAVLLRRGKHGTLGLGELVGVVGRLHEETHKVEYEVDNLCAVANGTPQPGRGRPPSPEQRYWQSKQRGGLRARLAAFFRGEDGELGADPGADVAALTQRVRDIKRQVADVKTKLRQAAPKLTPTQMPRSTRSESTHSSAHKPADAGGDIGDMEFFRSNPTTRESSAETPTIGSPYYQESKQARPIGHGEKAASRHSIPEVGEEIVEIYNRAVNDPFERERLRERYTAVRVGTVNAVERRQNPTIKAEYREASDGDFFAYPIGRGVYVVVPSLGLTIEAVGYTAGALGVVFGRTQGYDPQRFYSSYRVLQPALFKCEGDRWELISPGELELGPGD